MKMLPCLRVSLRSSLLLYAAWALALSGCAGAPSASIPTSLPEEYPAPVIALTAIETPEPETGPRGPANPRVTSPPSINRAEQPAATGPFSGSATLPSGSLPTGSQASPTLSLTLSPSPTTTPSPPAQGGDIWIYSPGPLSKVTSPLHLQASARPGSGGQAQVELLGQDGRVLARVIQAVHNLNEEGFASLVMDLQFEVAAAGEAGRLKISVDDAHGRMTSLNSVPLMLLSSGDPDILDPVNQPGSILLQQPSPGSQIRGGSLVVAGLARPASDQPLMVRLLTVDGSELGQRLAGVSAAQAGEYGLFAVEVPFTVASPTEALLVVWEGGRAIQDIIYLTSRVVLLSP